MCLEANISHDGDHDMLLLVEFTRVDAPGISEGCKLMSRKNLLQKFTCRESAAHDHSSGMIHWKLEGQNAQ